MGKMFMDIALEEAALGVKNGDGGPFGAVVVKDGVVVAKAHNRVVADNDPTAHAEVEAIRKAGKMLGRFDLSDCELYTTCEPCPMCYAAIQWAGIKKVYYGCTRYDAAKIGFDDAKIYDVIKGTNLADAPEMVEFCREEALAVFNVWDTKKDKVLY